MAEVLLGEVESGSRCRAKEVAPFIYGVIDDEADFSGGVIFELPVAHG
jgi:hypothetical protein